MTKESDGDTGSLVPVKGEKEPTTASNSSGVGSPPVIRDALPSGPSSAGDQRKAFDQAASQTPEARDRARRVAEEDEAKRRRQQYSQPARYRPENATTPKPSDTPPILPPGNTANAVRGPESGKFLYKEPSMLEKAGRGLKELLRTKTPQELERAKAAKEREKREEERKKFRRKGWQLPHVYPEGQVHLKSSRNKKERGGKGKEIKEEETDQNLIPISDLPLPLLVGPLLDLSLPISDPKNEARLELARMFATKELEGARNLFELVKIGQVLVDSAIEIRYIENIYWLLHNLNNLTRYLKTHPEDAYVEFEVLRAKPNLSEDFLQSVSYIWGAIDQINDMANRSDIFANNPGLLPAVWQFVTAEDSEQAKLLNKCSDEIAMAFLRSHLGYVSLSATDMQEYQRRVLDSQAFPVTARLTATFESVPLVDRYIEDPSKLLPPQLTIGDASQYRDDRSPLHWLLSHPPRSVLRAVYAGHQAIFNTLARGVPEIPDLRYDPSCLVLGRAEQRQSIDPQTLLERFGAEAESLAVFSRKVMPLINYLFVLDQVQNGQEIDQNHFSANMIGWLRQGGIAELVSHLGPTKLGHYVLEQAKDYGGVETSTFIPPEESIISIQFALEVLGMCQSNLIHDTTTFGNDDDPMYQLTRLLNPDYDFDSLTQYPSLAEVVYAEMMRREYVRELQDETGHTVVVIPKDQAEFITLPYLAELAGITDPVKVKNFCEIMRQITLNPPSDVRRGVYDNQKRQYAPMSGWQLFANVEDLRTKVRRACATNPSNVNISSLAVWFMPGGYVSEIKSGKVVGLGGKVELTELAYVGGKSDGIGWYSRDRSKQFTEPFHDVINTFAEQNSELADIDPSQLRAQISRLRSPGAENTPAVLQELIGQLREREQRLEQARRSGIFDTHRSFSDERKRGLREISQSIIGEYNKTVSEIKMKESQLKGETLIEEELTFNASILLRSFIRPIAASLCLAVMSIEAVSDKDITALVDSDVLKTYGLHSKEGELFLTAKGFTTFQLLEVIDSIDACIRTDSVEWKQIDDVLRQLQEILHRFDDYLQETEIPPIPPDHEASQFLLNSPANKTLLTTVPIYPESYFDIDANSGNVSTDDSEAQPSQRQLTQQVLDSLELNDRVKLVDNLKVELEHLDDHRDPKLSMILQRARERRAERRRQSYQAILDAVLVPRDEFDETKIESKTQ